MLDKLPKECWRKGKTFCDPAVGNGQFLIHILYRKLKRGHDPVQAVQCLYGADIMSDNIRECRCRLLSLLQVLGHVITMDHVRAVLKNIVYLPTTTYPRGSLSYDFEFSDDPPECDVIAWLRAWSQ